MHPDRVDADALLARVDADALLDRVDVDRLISRVDIDRLVARVDIDAFVERIPVDELVERAGIPDIVSDSTSHMAATFIDLLRRQAVGLDTIVFGLAQRLRRRRAVDLPQQPPQLLEGEAG